MAPFHIKSQLLRRAQLGPGAALDVFEPRGGPDAAEEANAPARGKARWRQSDLKRAIAAVPPEARSADAALSNLMDGVEATERGLEQTLTRFGVKPIEAKGQKFDPQKHQAMYEVELPDMPAGMVAEVVQGGYAIGERVLRPAMVAISKGGPKAAPSDKAD